MTPFLKQVAQYIFDEHKDTMASLCIVLPSKRGAVFLKKHLHEVFKTTIWLPQILSIDEFVAEVSDLNIIDQLNSLIEMHAFYQKNIEAALLQSTEIVTQQSDNKDLSFDQYLRKANIILQDFNEIDRHLVEPKDIFTNLKDIKYIENWSLNNDELSPFQKNYVALFDAMGKIYSEFTQHLLAKNEAYQGLAYRVAVKNFKAEKWTANHKHFLFCGFNAFNKAESLIISGLVNQKKATVLWDSDQYFVNNDIQEAGFFLREAKRSKQFGKDFLFENNNLATDEKNIEIVGAPNNMAQTQVIQSTLEKWAKGVYKPDQTAIVMADEALLMPVLYAIPEQIEKLNVTLGYEIKHSVVYDLFMKWLNLQEYASVNSNKLYYKDINKILSHVVIQKYFKNIEQKNHLQKLQKNLVHYNIIFTNFNRLQVFIDDDIQFIKQFFEPVDSPKSFIEKSLKLIEDLRDHLITANQTQRFNVIEEQVLFELHKLFNQLQSLITKINFDLNLKDIKALFQQIVSSTSVDFKGEPLNGLQIMGILESRTLDFENVIIVSVNEGVLPSGKGSGSYIPFDLKLHFDLPVHFNKDAIYAYHFWHMIQRAKNVCIIYNTEGDDLQKGEKSRFITQLETELVQVNKNITLTQRIHSPLVDIATRPVNLSIDSNASIQNILLERYTVNHESETQTGLSASSINTYINCPLKFYYQYILKLKETEEQEETIQANTFGNIVHKVLEMLYLPFVGKVLQTEELQKLISQVDQATDEAFKEMFDEEDFKKGKNLLAVISIKKYILQFIAFDMERITQLKTENQYITLLGLELNVKKELDLKINNENKPILFSGKIDRLEQIGNTISIIDFKSSLGHKNQLVIDHAEKVFDSQKPKDKAMQLLFYQWLLKDHPYSVDKTITSKILSIRSIKQGFHELVYKMEAIQRASILEDYSQLLKIQVQKIFDQKSIFNATSNLKICEWCAFQKICYRD
jgi:ATP-dependent helicase/nuclease subunit B